MENEICKGCQWNNYPTCKGTIMFDGLEMNIEKLRPGFSCGQKNKDNLMDFSIQNKSETELKIEDLEARLLELENK